MKKLLNAFLIGAFVAGGVAFSSYSNAKDADPIDSEEKLANKDADHPNWTTALKEKYNLTDDQIKKYRDSGLKFPQIAIVSQLSKDSSKSVDDIIKMRNEQHMGWGKIAKELGVKPGEIGRSISSIRHDVKEERKERHEKHRKEMHDKHHEENHETHSEHEHEHDGDHESEHEGSHAGDHVRDQEHGRGHGKSK